MFYIALSNVLGILTSIAVTAFFARTLSLEIYYQISVVSSWAFIVICLAKVDHEFIPLSNSLLVNAKNLPQESLYLDLKDCWFETTVILGTGVLATLMVLPIKDFDTEVIALSGLMCLYPYVAFRATWVANGLSKTLFYLSLLYKIFACIVVVAMSWLGHNISAYLSYAFITAILPELTLLMFFYKKSSHKILNSKSLVAALVSFFDRIKLLTLNNVYRFFSLLWAINLKSLERIRASLRYIYFPILIPISIVGLNVVTSAFNSTQDELQRLSFQQIISSSQRICSTIIPFVIAVTSSFLVSHNHNQPVTKLSRFYSQNPQKILNLLSVIVLVFSIFCIFFDKLNFVELLLSILFGKNYFSPSFNVKIVSIIILACLASSIEFTACAHSNKYNKIKENLSDETAFLPLLFWAIMLNMLTCFSYFVYSNVCIQAACFYLVVSFPLLVILFKSASSSLRKNIVV